MCAMFARQRTVALSQSTGGARSQETAPPCAPTVGLCLWPYGGPRGGGLFRMSEVPLYLCPPFSCDQTVARSKVDEFVPHRQHVDSRIYMHSRALASCRKATRAGDAKYSRSNGPRWARPTLGPRTTPPVCQSLFFSTLVTGPRRSLSLKLSDKRVYEP